MQQTHRSQHVWAIPHNAQKRNLLLGTKLGTLTTEIYEAKFQAIHFGAQAETEKQSLLINADLSTKDPIPFNKKFTGFVKIMAQALAAESIAQQYLQILSTLGSSTDQGSMDLPTFKRYLKTAELDHDSTKKITALLPRSLQEICETLDAIAHPPEIYPTVEEARHAQEQNQQLITDFTEKARGLQAIIHNLEVNACSAVLLTENEVVYERIDILTENIFVYLRSKRFIEAHRAAIEIQICEIKATLAARRVQQAASALLTLNPGSKEAEKNAPLKEVFGSIRTSVEASLTAIAAADCSKFLYPPNVIKKELTDKRTKAIYALLFLGVIAFVRNLIVKRLAFTALAPMVPAASVVIPVMSAAMTLSAVHVLYKKWCAKKPNEAPRPTGFENNNSKQKRPKTSQ